MVFRYEAFSSRLSDLTLNLIAGLVILLVGLVVGRFLGNLTRKVLHELELDRLLREQTRFKIPLEQLLGSLVKFVVYFIAIIFSLDQLGLQTAILNIILTIILIVMVVFMILAVKDFIPNLVSGLILHQKRNIRPGEKIEVNDIEGEVINITLIETKIRTKSGDIVYIPNSILTKNVVIKKK